MVARIVAAVALVLGIGALGASPALAADWEKERERERRGFTVWSRPVEGSAYREYMVELHIDAPAAAVWAALTDWEATFTPHVVVRQRLDAGGDGVVVYERVEYDPLPPRDYAVRQHVRSSSEPFELVGEVDNSVAPPPAEGVIRVTRHRHHWTVRSDGDGAVAVLITHHDPVDVVPAVFHKGFVASMKKLTKNLARAAGSR